MDPGHQDPIAADGDVHAPGQFAKQVRDGLLPLGHLAALVVVERADETQAVHLALANPLDALHQIRVDPHLEVDQEDLAVLGGLFAGGADGVRAGHVGGQGLGHVDVFARRHRRRGVRGEEARGRFEDYRVDVRGQQALVAQQAREAPGLGYAERLALGLGHVGEVVGAAGDLVAAVGGEQAGDPVAATAESHAADVDLRVRLGAADRRGPHDRRAGGDRRGGKKLRRLSYRRPLTFSRSSLTSSGVRCVLRTAPPSWFAPPISVGSCETHPILRLFEPSDG